MKKLILTATTMLVMSLVLPLNSTAILLTLDTGVPIQVFNPVAPYDPILIDSDGKTEGFNRMDYTAHTYSSLNLATNVVSDQGLGYVDDLMNGANHLTGRDATEALNGGGGYEITFYWNNLAGSIVDTEMTGNVYTQITTEYSAGSKINFQYDRGQNHADIAYGTSIPDTTYMDGQRLMEFTIAGGEGIMWFNTDGTFDKSTYDLFGYYSMMDTTEPFPVLSADTPMALAELVTLSWVVGATNGRDREGMPPIITYTADGMTVESIFNSDTSIDVVPEPSTIILLGSGLMGLGFYARRRKK